MVQRRVDGRDEPGAEPGTPPSASSATATQPPFESRTSRLTARWLLMAVFGDAGVGGLDLLWTYRY